MPQLDNAPVQYVTGVDAVIVDCAGDGTLCGVLASSSITQSALPAVSACVASNKNRFTTAIVNGCELLVPPSGVGENTVIVAVPADAIFAAGTSADNCVLLLYVVVSAVPFHFTVDVFTKPVPVTTIVNEPPPGVALPGLSAVSTGTGLLLEIIKGCGTLDPPPGAGFTTATEIAPAVTK